MEEIYLIMFLLVSFATAIYLIIQIPEVKDYIVPPSGQFNGIPTSSNTSNALSNRVTLSNTSNVLSNRVTLSNTSNVLSNIVTLSNTSNVLSNIVTLSNTSNVISNVISNVLSNIVTLSNTSNVLSNIVTLSNTSNDLSNIVTLSNTSNDLSNIVTLSNTSNILSNIGSNYSNSISGTPISGDLTVDQNLVFYTLRNNFFYDGSIEDTPQTKVYFTDMNSKFSFMNSGNLTDLNNRIKSALEIGNYSTIEEVASSVEDIVKYSYSIPPINTYQIINLNNLMNDAFTQDLAFNSLAITSVTTSNAIDTYNNIANFRTYSANWYIAYSNLASNILLSNYINVATTYLIDYFRINAVPE